MSANTVVQRNPEGSGEHSKEVVLAFLDALNRSDFEAARKHVTDDLRFEGVMGSREGADAYFRDMKHMQLKYNVKKAIAEGDDVCLFYDVTMSGVTVFCAGWYRLGAGKIRSFRVVFDPRAVLEATGKTK